MSIGKVCFRNRHCSFCHPSRSFMYHVMYKFYWKSLMDLLCLGADHSWTVVMYNYIKLIQLPCIAVAHITTRLYAWNCYITEHWRFRKQLVVMEKYGWNILIIINIAFLFAWNNVYAGKIENCILVNIWELTELLVCFSQWWTEWTVWGEVAQNL